MIAGSSFLTHTLRYKQGLGYWEEEEEGLVEQGLVNHVTNQDLNFKDYYLQRAFKYSIVAAACSSATISCMAPRQLNEESRRDYTPGYLKNLQESYRVSLTLRQQS